MTAKVLITTPDYPPKRIGGISTFVLNLEKALVSLGVSYEIFVWDSPLAIKKLDLSKYETILNVHFHALFFMKHKNIITYVHGGELFAYSKNPFKRFLKKIGHKKILSHLDKSKINVFVSNYSFNLCKSLRGNIDYSKNIVYHNCIDISHSEFISKNLLSEIKLCCFVRNVPHKNVKGTIELYKKIKSAHSGRVTLTITARVETDDPDIICIPSASDEQREKILRESHLNLLLSLDHSKKGNIEGFGLTVLESGKYGVPTLGLSNGGLSESIHHFKTGLLIDKLNKDLYQYLLDEYEVLSKNVFEHTHLSHGITQLERQLDTLIRPVL